uniref:non-specific serine/threonine protein kinase n=1 Tax=Leersia perrieri TaxID=77586 RepID=A0A0D9XV61_9ORYZ
MASDAVLMAANIAQLTGVGALPLITMIVEAAKAARRNEKTCLELAQLVEQVGELLRALQEQPGETLRRAYELVASCRRGSYPRRFCAGKDQAGSLRDRDEDDVLMSLTNRPHPQARFQKFSFSQLVHATNDFSLDGQLEQGTLAILYKGKLHGNDVTIKRLSVSTSGQRLPEYMNENELFKNEIKILPELQHRNIAKLVGFCTEQSERAMVYKCMENGSLENIIFGITFFLISSYFNDKLMVAILQAFAGPASARSMLDWSRRFRIIEGIAHGVAYLHNYSRVRVVHRDLKPSNILLDSDMNPKISNFELAEMLSMGTDEQKTDNVAGSIGFSAPEYMHRGIFSVKTDVYSFGIMAWSCCSLYAGRRLKDLINPSLHGVSSISRALPHCLSFPARRRALSQQREMQRCVRVALLCIQEKPKRRPAMVEVVHMLRQRRKDTPPLPGRSRFTTASTSRAANDSRL